MYNLKWIDAYRPIDAAIIWNLSYMKNQIPIPICFAYETSQKVTKTPIDNLV